MTPRILIVDDDESFREDYTYALQKQGFDVVEAASREAALRCLEGQSPWDVVILDEHLAGPGGPATAIDVLGDLRRLAPEARTLVVSAYRDRKKMEAALDAGAWDYLNKDEFLLTLLKVKVRQAVEVALELRLRGQSRGDREQELRASWAQSLDPTTRREHKGRHLEDAIDLLFRSMPGLNTVSRNRRNEVEEIDLVIRNESTDLLLMREGSYILVECKNWSTVVGAAEVTRFRTKLQDRFERVRLGLLIATGGFAKEVEHTLSRMSNGPELVVLINREEMEAWLEASDRVEWLKAQIEAAVLRQSKRA